MKKNGNLGLIFILILIPALAFSGCGGGSGGGGNSGGGGTTFKVLFASNRDLSGGANIYSMNLDGSNATKLTTDGGATVLNGRPELSPDYSKILYVKTVSSSSVAIWVMNADGTGGKQIYSVASPNTLFPSWTPSGKIIFFDFDNDGSAVGTMYIMDADGNNKAAITYGSQTFYFPMGPPRISPNGAKIALSYAVNSSTDTYNYIYVADFDSTSGTITSAPTAIYSSSNAYDPAWSPDGTKIVFDADSSGGSYTYYDLYMISASGGTATKLTTNQYIYVPKYSADGSKTVFVDYSSTYSSFDIFSINSSGGSLTNLTKSTYLDAYYGDESYSGTAVITNSLAAGSVHKKYRK